METPNPKCPRCRCYWKPDETDIRTSGLVAKTCKKCRDKQKKSYNNLDKDVKVPELNENCSFKIKGVEYEVKTKYIDEDIAMKLMPNYGKKYENIDDIPDENEIIPDECTKYVLGAKITPEMMDKMGIRITSADDEDNNIYPE